MTHRLLCLLVSCNLLAQPLLAAEPPKAPAKPAELTPLEKQWERECEAEKTIEAALAKVVSIEYQDLDLPAVVAELSEKWKVPIHIHYTVEKPGPQPTAMRGAVKNISARTALTMLLAPYELDWDIDQEVIWILPKQHDRLRIRTYPVHDLVSDDGACDFDPILELITNTVQPTTWEAAGGRGNCKGWITGECLVISQTRPVHEELDKLLHDLRAVKRKVNTESANPRSPSAIPKTSSRTPTIRPVKLPPDEQTTVDGTNQFACDLYQKVRQPGQNTFFSPFSIGQALGMVYAGAREETAAEIATALHNPLPAEQFHAALGTVRTNLLNAEWAKDAAQISLANRLFLQNGHPLLESFIATTRKQYGATVGLIDFQRPGAREEINQWVAGQTNQKIPTLLPRGVPRPSDDPRLILVNAVYFQARWESPFEGTQTKPGKFFRPVANGAEVTVNATYMNQSVTTKYGKVDDVQVLELAYQGTPLVMNVLLPSRDVAAYSTLQDNLSAESITRYVTNLKPRLVELKLPKFQLTTGLQLDEKLRDLGVRRLFDATKQTGDLSGIDGQRGANGLCITDAFHQAFINVDEEGTEAAAASAMVGAFGGAITRPTPFSADHPFIFLIRDTASGVILLLGHYEVPN